MLLVRGLLKMIILMLILGQVKLSEGLASPRRVSKRIKINTPRSNNKPKSSPDPIPVTIKYDLESMVLIYLNFYTILHDFVRQN